MNLGNLSNVLVNYSTTTTTTTNGPAAAAAIISMMMTIWIVVLSCVLVIYIVTAIGNYKVFQKCGEEGWKAFIPFYNEYTRYKLMWQTKFFWWFLLCSTVGVLACGLGPFVAIGFQIASWDKQCKCFNYPIGYLFGFIFLNPIFTLINGFDKSTYLGNAVANPKNPANFTQPPVQPQPNQQVNEQPQQNVQNQVGNAQENVQNVKNNEPKNV